MQNAGFKTIYVEIFPSKKKGRSLGLIWVLFVDSCIFF